MQDTQPDREAKHADWSFQVGPADSQSDLEHAKFELVYCVSGRLAVGAKPSDVMYLLYD